MKLIGVLVAFAMCGSVYAQTFENSIQAVERNQAKTDILVYKVKNQIFELQAQNWQPFIARQAYKTHGLFQHMARVMGASEQLGRYFVRKYPTATRFQNCMRCKLIPTSNLLTSSRR
jgi:predicted lipoprotein with Yx(FWY)xxD motif